MNVRYERGQVVWAELEPTLGREQAGHRPVLIVSENRFNAASGTVIAMPLTSKQPKAPYPFAVEAVVGGASSWVKPAQVRTLSVERLGRVLGAVDVLVVETCLAAVMQVCGHPSERKSDNDA